MREETREKWEKVKKEIKNGREKKNSTSFLMFYWTCIEIIKFFYKIQVIQNISNSKSITILIENQKIDNYNTDEISFLFLGK